MLPVGLLAAGIALALISNRGPKGLTEVRSRKDGNVYRVQDLPDKQEAADHLANIRANMEKLIEHYKKDPSSMTDPRVKVLVGRFNPDCFMENDIESNSTSYSENKGEKIVVCIRDKRPPHKFIDENTIMFVLLHEMAHLMTTSVGHTPEFWTNFKRILQDAVQCGIYTEVNYAREPTPYCGMTITDTPI